jgi:hypothetical protein
MFSPYEELEYLSDYLPEEGEVVLLTRQSGELVCKPYGHTDLREGIEDAELYGALVQANERLQLIGQLPFWLAAIILFWLVILVHGVMQVSWDNWYLMPAAGFLLFYGAMSWTRMRQRRMFRSQILPAIIQELARRRIRPYALIAGVRQHGELRTLLDGLVRWAFERQLPLT